MNGGPHGIIVILALVIGGMWFERQRLIKENAKKDDRLDKIIDDYYKGNLTLSEALNSLKAVLFEIKDKF
jgi:FtsZ-interacting cell division protein ZipA